MMKTSLLLVLLALLPACQTGVNQQLADADRQLESYQTVNNQLLTERERVRAENASLTEQLSFEHQRASDLSQRVGVMEADLAARDAEVDTLRSAFDGTGVGVERRGDYLVLDLPSALSFDSGRDKLTAKGKAALKVVAATLQADYADKIFWVEGHTDNDPIKKSKWSSNLQLSVARSMAVITYLTKDMGLDWGSFRVAGHGEWSPKSDNNNKKGKASNRRVEIIHLG